MKLKTNNSAKKPVNTNKNKSPKKQAKGGVQVRKEKSKDVVKPTVLKKEGEKVKVETPPNPEKLALQELWSKAIQNVSNMPNLSEEESSIAKLLGDYKNKSSVPQKRNKLKNMITKGFSKFKDTSDEVLDGIFEKLINEFKAIGGNVDSIKKDKSKKPESKTPKSKKEEASNDEMDDDEDEVDDDEDEVDDEDDDDDEIEGLEIDDDDDDDVDEESEEEKPKPKGKSAFKNGKSQSNKDKNGSKFKGGKVQKNKKFGKKK